MRTPAAVERHARLLVVGGHPARADPHLEPAVGEQVDGGGFTREHDRMLVVVAEDERADAQGRRHRGRGRERGDGRERMVDEVVGHVERRVTERLGLPRGLGELLCRTRLRDDHSETEPPTLHALPVAAGACRAHARG